MADYKERFNEEMKKMGVTQDEIDKVERMMQAVHQRLNINIDDPKIEDLPKALFLHRVFSMMPVARALGISAPLAAEVLHACADAIELAHKEFNK